MLRTDLTTLERRCGGVSGILARGGIEGKFTVYMSVNPKFCYIDCMKMTLAFVIVVVSICSGVVAQTMRPFFDGRLSLQPTQPSNTERISLQKTVRLAAREAWSDAEYCNDEFSVTDTASGTFTRPRANQRLFLYQFCTTGHNFANNGLAVFESGRLVMHVIYKGSWDNALGALADINQNGLNEILISTGGTSMGQTWGVTTLLELSNGFVKKLGTFDVYEDSCGTVGGQGVMKAIRLSVVASPRPSFFQQTFSGSCASGKMGQASRIFSVEPRVNGIVYQRVF